MASPHEEIEEEINKAQAWYAKTYRKTFKVLSVYDKQEKRFHWRVIANIGGQERFIPFGASVKTLEGPEFPKLKAKVLEFIKQSLIKAQSKYEPHILMRV